MQQPRNCLTSFEASRKEYKILIVEDTTFINNLFANSLSQNGYSCYQAFTLKAEPTG